MKKIIFFALIFACLFSSSFAETSTQSKVINVQAGQEFTVTLESNITTGYQWQLAKPLDESSFQLIKSEYVADKTDRVGSGGKQILVLKALKAGEATISFKYVRPWEKDIPAVEEETYLINITKGDS